MEKEIINISKKNYKEYTNLDVVAFSFAHGGAQGAGGEIIVITKDAKIYSMNYVYGDMEIEMCDEVCPPLKYCEFGFFSVEDTPIGWRGVNLGGGNFLVLSESVYHQMKEDMFRIQPYELYGKWMDMVLNCIKKS